MFARKFNSDGRIRCPIPCRARKATRLPRSVPTTYGPDGSPNGVGTFSSFVSVSSAMSYRPLPPMMPIVGCVIFLWGWAPYPGSVARGGPTPRSAPSQRAPARQSCLLKLDEDAAGARRMNERDHRSFCAGPRLLVDESDAARLQRGEHFRHILDAKRQVVNAGAAFFDVLRNRRRGRSGLQEFDSRLADGREVNAHLLRRHVFSPFDLEAERVAIERKRGF